MFKRFVGAAAGAAVVSSGGAIAEDKPYELLAATLDGRPTLAIVDRHGTAIAVELQSERPQIVRGLAAGAILSDLRDVVEVKGSSEPEFVVQSNNPIKSEIKINGEVKVGRISKAETKSVIDRLPHLNDAQKNELRSLLSLQ